MRVSYGNGGWVRVDGVGLPGPLYVRFAADERGRWRVVEIYIDGHDTPLSTAMLRQLRLDLLEAAVLQYDNMAARSQTPGPDLHRLAAHYATTWGKSAYDGQHCDTCGSPIKGARGRILALRNWVAGVPPIPRRVAYLARVDEARLPGVLPVEYASSYSSGLSQPSSRWMRWGLYQPSM
jgi:hypothetical protein